jgi:hypothetical protein
MDSTATTPQTVPTPEVPLTVSDQQTSALLDETLALLSHGLPPQKGDRPHIEIERWETVLASLRSLVYCAKPSPIRMLTRTT